MRQRLALVALSLILGCADGGPALHLLIDTDIATPGDLDKVLVTINASSWDTYACQGQTALFRVESAEDLPLFVRIERGELYTKAASWQIVGYKNAAPVTPPLESWAPWPDQGVQEIGLLLEETCRQIELDGGCDVGLHCTNAKCRPTPRPTELTSTDRLDDVPCWQPE